MDKFETAIAEITYRAEHTLKTVISAETAEMVVEALQAQAERDKMRCENCTWFKQNWCNEVMARPIKPTDFCSYFEPKGVRNDEKRDFSNSKANFI